jgi:hypothetical protein
MKTLADRFKPYASRYSLHPACYEICDANRSSKGWVSRTTVLPKFGDNGVMVYDPEYTGGSQRTFPTEEQADAASYRFGVMWLEQNA